MSDFVLAVISFVIVIGPLILIHELGHFLAARFVGVTVLEFGIGFPPRAIKLFEQGGTEFTINWLPIGGFVRPLGEDFVRPVGEAATDSERAELEKRQGERQALEGGAASAKPFKTKSLMEAGPWQRILFMSAGMLMNIAAGIILFTIAALIGVPVMQSAKMGVSSVDSGSFAAKAGFLVGDVITTVNGTTVNSLDTLNAALCQRNGNDLSVVITRAGQNIPLTLPDPGVSGGVLLRSVQNGQPAKVAGLQANDRILKADDQPICGNNDLFNYEAKTLGKAVTFTYIRSGETTPQTMVVNLNPQMPALGASIETVDMATVYGFT
jgi:RIP metalloprotease RseP